MKSKLILIYLVVFVYLVLLGLTHLNESFIFLSFVSMGFIWGFMANECFFDGDPKRERFPITEGTCLSNIKSAEKVRNMPGEPPPALAARTK